MTHDPDVTTPGSWLIGTRRASRAAAVDETTVDLGAFGYERMLANAEAALERAENRVVCGLAAIDARVGHTRQRQLWAGLTQEQMLAAFADALLEVRTVLAPSGKAE